MAIQFDMLPGVLFRPTETFKKLHKSVNMEDGLKLWLIVTLISSVFAFVTQKVTMGKTMGMYPSGDPTYAAAYSDGALLITLILGIIFGLIFFLLISWLIAKLTKSLSGGKGDVGKTVGALAYASAAFGLIIGIPLSILQTIFILAMPMDTLTLGGGFFIYLMIMLLVAFLMLLWEFYVYGKAIAEVNEINFGAALVSLLIAGILLIAILLVLVIIIAIIVGFAAFSSMSTTGAAFGM